jgi:hypothetical protein
MQREMMSFRARMLLMSTLVAFLVCHAWAAAILMPSARNDAAPAQIAGGD